LSAPGSKTVLPPLKRDVCFTPEKQTSVSYAADCDFVVGYGGAKPTDKHLASKIHCVDDESGQIDPSDQKAAHAVPAIG
jgi:hypothetical protein